MKKLAVLVLFIACAIGARSPGQIAAAPAGSPAPTKKAEKPKEKGKNKDKKKEDKSSGTNLLGSGAAGLQSNEPTTTQIYADEAFFDSTKNMGISQNSQLRTHGPSRTEIVQQPNEDKKGKASPSQTPGAAQASPAPSLPKP